MIMSTQEHPDHDWNCHWTEWFTLETKVVHDILKDEAGEDPHNYWDDCIGYAIEVIEAEEAGTFDCTQMETLAEFVRDLVQDIISIKEGNWVSNKLTRELLGMACHKVEWSVIAFKIDTEARAMILRRASP